MPRICDQNVAGFNVAVHHTQGVDHGQAVGHLLENIEGVLLGDNAVTYQTVRQGFPRDVLHDDETEGVVSGVGNLAVIVGLHHIIGVDFLRSQGLVAEAAQKLAVVGKLGAQNLDRDLAVAVVDVVCQPHCRHAAVPDDPLQGVVGADELLEALNPGCIVVITHVL